MSSNSTSRLLGLILATAPVPRGAQQADMQDAHQVESSQWTTSTVPPLLIGLTNASALSRSLKALFGLQGVSVMQTRQVSTCTCFPSSGKIQMRKL